ncbi:MAG: type IVB secretion system protein IcmH/DotU [Marinagarivorans sp.]|nr:type IVB secretion system protein IcmH/DotU [Marinagarivorans sp.]
MTGNDSDKTVFKQPMPGGDRTGMRKAPNPREPVMSPAPQADAYVRQSALPLNRPFIPDVNVAQFKAEHSVNPLVNAAATLIAVFTKTRSTARHSDVGGLHQRLVAEIKNFESRLRDLNLKQEQLLSARYLMCSVLDEAVLNTPWGSESAWAQRTLLSVFHGETSGGEKSFLILERLKQTPSENLDLLELFYICISLGFEGRYRLMSRGREGIEQVREEIFSIVRRYRGDYERSLSPSWVGLGHQRNPLTEYVPLWFVIALMLAVLFFSYSGLRYWLYSSSTPVVQEISELLDKSKPTR